MGLVALPALEGSDLLAPVLADPEKLFLVLAFDVFPPLLGSLLLVGLIAAVMSTADSQLLLVSAVATDNVPGIKEFAAARSARGQVWLGRGLLLLAGGIAAILAIVSASSVAVMVEYAWGRMGAAFGPVILLSHFWRRFNLAGTIAAIGVGALTAVVWVYLTGGPAGIWDIQSAFPGSIAAAAAVTLGTADSPVRVTSLFDRVLTSAEGSRPSALDSASQRPHDPSATDTRRASAIPSLNLSPFEPSVGLRYHLNLAGRLPPTRWDPIAPAINPIALKEGRGRKPWQ